MPRGKVKILKANGGTLIWEITVGEDYRFSIPRSIRNLVETKETVQITIRKSEEVIT
jgi:hypothetical protein